MAERDRLGTIRLRMLIALDYDGTYTADPGLWHPFIAASRARGHLRLRRDDAVPVRGP